MGGVFSHTYSSINQLWGAFAFHLIAMIAGLMCIAKSMNRQQKA